MTWRRPWGLQVSWERCLRFFFFTIHLEILVQIHMYHLTYSIVLECDLKTNHLPRAGSKLGSFLNLYTKIPPKTILLLGQYSPPPTPSWIVPYPKHAHVLSWTPSYSLSPARSKQRLEKQFGQISKISKFLYITTLIHLFSFILHFLF